MNRLTIAPIGTCRIHTPLRRGQRRYPINVNLDRVYGFTHTSDEALQMVRYLQGEKTFQPETIPVIYRQDRDNGLVDAAPSPSDLTIVEISSAKKITSGDDSVQSNYLYHHLSDFFADPVRTQKFWSMVRREARPDLHLGVCGEHGGDPASIHFFAEVGLDYVSCSPYRVPVARLGAGRAALG